MDRGITCSRNAESFLEATDLKSNSGNIKKRSNPTCGK
jgi:hypothetical protein